MKSKRISEFGYQLTKAGLINAYLVREQDGFTLIDTAMGEADAILKSAASLGMAIQRIVLTHAHLDHIGSLDALAKQRNGGNAADAPQLEVAIGERESRLLPKPPAQDLRLDTGEPQCAIKGSLPGATTQATRVLTDDELYGSLRSIATPGHTPGHFGFLDERDGTFYAGDALVTLGGGVHVVGFGPWYFPFAAFATWHKPTAVASIRRLLDRPLATPIQRIAPGHGRVVEGGVSTLQAALRNAT